MFVTNFSRMLLVVYVLLIISLTFSVEHVVAEESPEQETLYYLGDSGSTISVDIGDPVHIKLRDMLSSYGADWKVRSYDKDVLKYNGKTSLPIEPENANKTGIGSMEVYEFQAKDDGTTTIKINIKTEDGKEHKSFKLTVIVGTGEKALFSAPSFGMVEISLVLLTLVGIGFYFFPRK
jgi:predicted secreted protein